MILMEAICIYIHIVKAGFSKKTMENRSIHKDQPHRTVFHDANDWKMWADLPDINTFPGIIAETCQRPNFVLQS